MSILAPIAVGEFLDKWIILQIKRQRVRDPARLDNIQKEHDALAAVWQAAPCRDMDLDEERAALKEINEKLWQVEDDLRAKEARQEFDQAFIDLARSVYKMNDRRAAIKKRINEKTGSKLVEEKSYAERS